jgi:putative transposase
MCCQSNVLFTQSEKKPCRNLELDSKCRPGKISSKRKKIEEYIVDETLIQDGSELVWLWVAIGPENRQILALSISKERNMRIAERFLSGLARVYGKHPISTDGGIWYP